MGKSKKQTTLRDAFGSPAGTATSGTTKTPPKANRILRTAAVHDKGSPLTDDPATKTPPKEATTVHTDHDQAIPEPSFMDSDDVSQSDRTVGTSNSDDKKRSPSPGHNRQPPAAIPPFVHKMTWKLRYFATSKEDAYAFPGKLIALFKSILTTFGTNVTIFDNLGSRFELPADGKLHTGDLYKKFPYHKRPGNKRRNTDDEYVIMFSVQSDIAFSVIREHPPVAYALLGFKLELSPWEPGQFDTVSVGWLFGISPRTASISDCEAMLQSLVFRVTKRKYPIKLQFSSVTSEIGRSSLRAPAFNIQTLRSVSARVTDALKHSALDVTMNDPQSSAWYPVSYQLRRTDSYRFHALVQQQLNLNLDRRGIVVDGLDSNTLFHIREQLVDKFPGITNIWSHRFHDHRNEAGNRLGRHVLECHSEDWAQLISDLHYGLDKFYDTLLQKAGRADTTGWTHPDDLVYPRVVTPIPGSATYGGSPNNSTIGGASLSSWPSINTAGTYGPESAPPFDTMIDLPAFELDLSNVHHVPSKVYLHAQPPLPKPASQPPARPATASAQRSFAQVAAHHQHPYEPLPHHHAQRHLVHDGYSTTSPITDVITVQDPSSDVFRSTIASLQETIQALKTQQEENAARYQQAEARHREEMALMRTQFDRLVQLISSQSSTSSTTSAPNQLLLPSGSSTSRPPPPSTPERPPKRCDTKPTPTQLHEPSDLDTAAHSAQSRIAPTTSPAFEDGWNDDLSDGDISIHDLTSRLESACDDSDGDPAPKGPTPAEK
jgi:hypothetical protein